MTELQKRILEVFKKFQEICGQNNLQYYAIGGTCLGAIRHGGFIPWDDDLDVAMPLDDYNKFRGICKNNPSLQYGLFDWEDKRHSEITFLKFYDKRTTFIESAIAEMPDRYIGVFMDIMPIVGLPDDNNVKEKFLRKCLWYGRFDRACRFEVKYKESLKSKIFSIVSRPLMIGKSFNYYSLRYEEYIAQNKFGATNRVLFPWRIPLEAPYKNIFPYEIFKENIEVPFENTIIYVPKGYDQYLRMDFGDYMRLPPEEKRRGGHPAAVIDFNVSYKYYQEKKDDHWIHNRSL